MKKPKVSIIIVHYKVKKDLFECLYSIYKNIKDSSFEIIVVDNDEKATIEKDLRLKFKDVSYIKSQKNLGYGGGNNLGAKHAKGEYLFFLNPDTHILKLNLSKIISFLEKNRKAGAISPLLVGADNKQLPQGGELLTPLKAISLFSFINKLFPGNPISGDFWTKDFTNEFTAVKSIPGTSFIISKKLFDKAAGFDERFFLYFEEFDICKRISDLGFKSYIYTDSKVLHKWERSTKDYPQKDKVFENSRFKYFKKHFGVINALFVEFFLRINKTSLLVFFALISALFLRLYNLPENMTFIGDQGWFYLSARDLLINGDIPLVGITSSHTWLHQGPLWTYMLTIPFLLFNFSPVSGGYLTAVIGVASTFLIYKVGSNLFSRNTGIIGALLYAFSPLVIFFDRMPFDPAPIPLFTTLYLFVLVKWIKGNKSYFPFIFFLLAILYNLELATFTLFFPFAAIFLFGLVRKEKWALEVINKKTIVYSLILLVLPMIPILIYDFSNGFKQTIVFLGWTLYKPFSFLFKDSAGNLITGLSTVFVFLIDNVRKLVFFQNSYFGFLLFITSLIFILSQVIKQRKLESGFSILLLLLAVSLLGIVINQTPSDAYLPIIFPFVIFALAFLFDYLLKIRAVKYITFLVLLLILISNGYSSIKRSVATTELKNRIEVTDRIIALSKDQEYNLIGKGEGSQFRSFTMNYEYLLWWKGHPVSSNNEKLKIVVFEEKSGIKVYKLND